MPDIATLSARVAITGTQDAKAGLRDVRTEMEGAASAGDALSRAQAALGERISASVVQSIREVSVIGEKEKSIAAMAAKYVEASSALQEWIKQNGESNVQALQQEANLDRLALSIQKEAIALRDLQVASEAAAKSESQAIENSISAKSLTGAGEQVRNTREEVGALFEQLSGVMNLGGIGGMLTGGLGIAGIAAIGKAIFDFGDATATSITQITNLSQRVGMGREEFARLAEATDDASLSTRGVGVSYEQVGSALETFNNQVGRGQLALDGFNVKGGAAKAAFEALGVQLEDASGKSRGTMDVLLDTADAMRRMGDSAERTALAKRLGLYELLPILAQGRDGIKEMMGAVDDSLIPTAEAEKAAIRLKEAEDNLDDSFRGLKQTVGVELLPVLTQLVDKTNATLDTTTKGIPAFIKMLETGSRRGAEYNQSILDLVDALEGSTSVGDVWYRELLKHSYAYQVATQAAGMNAAQIQGWSDAYAESAGRVASATSALPKNEMGDWAAAWEDAVSRVDGRMTYIAAAGEDKLGALKERVDALFGSLGKPLPEAATPRGKVEMAGQLITGKTTPDKLGAELLGEAIGAAATASNWKQLVEIEQQAADGTLNYVSALQQVIALAPKMVDNKLAQSVKDYSEVIKATGKDGGIIPFFSDQVRQVQVFVKGTQEGATEYAKAVAKIEEDKKRLERNTGAVTTWNATKSWPADQTPAKMEAERLQIEAQIKKDEDALARWKRVKEGYWTTVTEFKDMPSFANKSPSKGMEAHHDKFDPAELDLTPYRDAGGRADQAIAKGIADNGKLAIDAVSTVILAAHTWTQTPEYDTLWHGAGTRAVAGIETGIRQEGWRINDAVMNQLSGILPNIVRAVIDTLRRG